MIIMLQVSDTTAIISNQKSDSISSFNLVMWISLFLLSAIIYIVYWKLKKKKQESENIDFKDIFNIINDEEINNQSESDNNKVINTDQSKNLKGNKKDSGRKEIKKVKEEIKVKTIGYKPHNNFLQKEPYSYPYVKFPNINTPIKFPKNGRSNKKGFKEDDFYKYLNDFFINDFKVFNDKHIPQQNGHRPYEPDFIIINENDNKNIFINIEIDEPYEGLSKTPTHIINQDNYRDLFFTNRGYIVIKFTEKQIHLNPISCCEFIALVIKSIDSSFTYSNVEELNELEIESQWDSIQAKKWAYEKYRESYLGIDSFGIRQESINNLISKNSDEDEIVEKLVATKIKKPIKVEIPKDYLEKKHVHARDKRIYFEPDEHKYLIDNNPDTISVSQLIDRFFPEFDSLSAAANLKSTHEYYGKEINEIINLWKKNGLEKADLGTKLHTEIENYYNKKEFNNNTKEFLYFQNFINTYPRMNPYRTEWRIFDEDLMIAGTIDMVYKKENGEYFMFDWKRSEKVVNDLGMEKLSDPFNPYTKFAFGELSHLTDDSYNKYLLQQNIYRHILEKKYNISISSMNLLILHQKYDNYKLLNLPKLESEIEYIFETSKLIT